MNWTLEVVVVPVSDVDRSKQFYEERVGFGVDHDLTNGGMRVVQLTPPGSGCSVVLGPEIPGSVPGAVKGLQLVVADVQAARAELVGRGVEVSEVQRFSDDDGGAFVYFSDPDGNGWAVQEIRARG